MKMFAWRSTVDSCLMSPGAECAVTFAQTASVAVIQAAAHTLNKLFLLTEHMADVQDQSTVEGQG